MEPQLEKIREVQKEAWNKASAGWKKWDDMMMAFLKPMSDEMIHLLQVNENDHIMDVATGTGEPGLTITSKLKTGKVTATDLSEAMLVVAKENAAKHNIRNFETVCCDVSTLPFDNDMFNGISCRLGFMFFPDMQLALNEMVRVLKPGGRIVASTWSDADKNSWISTSMGTMITCLNLTPPAPGAPGPFRCAQQGLLAEMYKKAGLKRIVEKEVSAKLPCSTTETYWNFITEAASPMAFSKADDTTKNQIKEEILSKINQKYPNGNIALDSCAIVICGEK